MTRSTWKGHRLRPLAYSTKVKMILGGIHFLESSPLQEVSQEELSTCAFLGGIKSPQKQFSPSERAMTGLFNMMQMSWQFPGDWNRYDP